MSSMELLNRCTLCIRNCNINRLEGNLGYCKSSQIPKVARAELHFWEEPCISGETGSGTVFFSNCNLSCVFCQNHRISQDGNGKEVNQYTPMHKACEYPEINKSLNPKHYDSLIDYTVDLGVKNGFIQDTGTNTEAYVPDFHNQGV